MGNALLFTACLLGAAVLGGFVGACCSKGRQAGDHEGRIAELEDRLDALADHVMEEVKSVRARATALENGLDAFQVHCLEQEQAIHAQLDEHEFLIGDTPTGGLLGRVGALEEAERHRPSGPKLTELVSCVDAQADRIEEVRHELYEQIRDIVGTGEEVQVGR